jgi:hypothetical protein
MSTTGPARPYIENHTWSINPLHVGIGMFPRWSVIDKFGKNAAVGTSFEPVSNGGSAVLLTTAETLDIVSNNDNDTLLGTGAQKITIEGLDANFAEQTLEVDMDGQTPVTTTGTTWMRFFIAKVTQVGSDASSTNIGTITISATTTTTATLIILPVEGRTQNAQYTIPAGKTGFLDKIFFTSDAALVMTGQLQVRPFEEGWQVQREMLIQNEHIFDDLSGSDAIPEKSDIRWMAKAATGVTNDATGGFKILLRSN